MDARAPTGLPLLLLVQATLASAQVTAIRAGRVVDPDAATAAEKQVTPRVEAGLPAAVILKAMTTNATRLLGVHGVHGVRETLTVGRYADLSATPDNPLTRIQTLKQVTFVVKNGRIVER